MSRFPTNKRDIQGMSHMLWEDFGGTVSFI